MIIEKRSGLYRNRNILIFLLLFIWLISVYTSINSFSLMTATRPLIRNIENKIVLYKIRNFNELETDNFVFKYENNIDKQVLDIIINTAEDKYEKITEIFQYKPKQKVLVIIYKNMDLMMSTTMLKKGDPPMGVYYGDSIHIADPKIWVDKTEEIEYAFYSKGPMLHELAHLFTDHIGKGNFPMWLTEGVSLYLEYMIDGYEWGKEVTFQKKDYKIRELNTDFKSLNQYEAYTKSFRLVRNLVENQGLDKLMYIIGSLGKGHNLDEFIYLFEEI